MNKLSVLKSFAIAALAAGVMATPTLANDYHTNSSVTVHFADLDTQSDMGAQALLNRIRGAAKRVCGPRPGFRELGERTAYQGCVSTAIESAVLKLDNPLVTALHSGTHRTQIAGGVR